MYSAVHKVIQIIPTFTSCRLKGFLLIKAAHYNPVIIYILLKWDYFYFWYFKFILVPILWYFYLRGTLNAVLVFLNCTVGLNTTSTTGDEDNAVSTFSSETESLSNN